jgi:hypothetical protein
MAAVGFFVVAGFSVIFGLDWVVSFLQEGAIFIIGATVIVLLIYISTDDMQKTPMFIFELVLVGLLGYVVATVAQLVLNAFPVAL